MTKEVRKEKVHQVLAWRIALDCITLSVSAGKILGFIVDVEKDDRYKILKEASEGPVVVIVEQRKFKSGPLDTKFTALDRHSKTISIDDTVKMLKGQYEDKQGVVKQIYRGTIFLYEENGTDNGGYICCKSQMCEKVKQLFEACNEKVVSEMNIDFPLCLSSWNSHDL